MSTGFDWNKYWIFPDLSAGKPNLLWRIKSRVTIASVGWVSRIWVFVAWVAISVISRVSGLFSSSGNTMLNNGSATLNNGNSGLSNGNTALSNGNTARNEKFLWIFPDFSKPQRAWDIKSRLTMTSVGWISKFWLCYLNRVHIHNKQSLDDVMNKVRTRPVITFSNHHSCLDDPGLWGMLSWKQLATPNKMRWALAAHDICFTQPLHGTFFSWGQSIPVVRGDGVYQRGLDFAISRLNENAWVHVFPEAGINMEQRARRIKWGIGRMVAECDSSPLILPFYVCGMDSVLPNCEPYIPQIGKVVSVYIGEPFDLEHTRGALHGATEMEKRKVITDIVQEKLDDLREKCNQFHMVNSRTDS